MRNKFFRRKDSTDSLGGRIEELIAKSKVREIFTPFQSVKIRDLLPGRDGNIRRLIEILNTSMAFSFFLMLLSYSPLSKAAEKPFIISGYDDVLRQAENTGLIKSALKICEKDKTYSGMPELYTIISRGEQAPKFVLVSAISTLFESRISKFLAKSNFPENRRYLRNWVTEWSIEKFKIARVSEILKLKPHRKFIVIFDNSDASVALVDELYTQFPDKIHAIYLHQVVKKETPTGAISFFTAFDIALTEYLANRMSSAEVNEVGNAILKEAKSEMIFPSYSICPDHYNPCANGSAEIEKICVDVRAHIEFLCRQRDSIK